MESGVCKMLKVVKSNVFNEVPIIKPRISMKLRKLEHLLKDNPFYQYYSYWFHKKLFLMFYWLLKQVIQTYPHEQIWISILKYFTTFWIYFIFNHPVHKLWINHKLQLWNLFKWLACLSDFPFFCFRVILEKNFICQAK